MSDRIDSAPHVAPVLVLRCEHCNAEEPAPLDLAEGETTDCAYCGEVAQCEAADALPPPPIEVDE